MKVDLLRVITLVQVKYDRGADQISRLVDIQRVDRCEKEELWKTNGYMLVPFPKR